MYIICRLIFVAKVILSAVKSMRGYSIRRQQFVQPIRVSDNGSHVPNLNKTTTTSKSIGKHGHTRVDRCYSRFAEQHFQGRASA